MEVLNIYEREKFPMMNEKLYDVIVIGGGPAGLTAALYLARAGCRTLVVEKRGYGGQIAITDEVVNYPGVLTTSGMELTETMRHQAESFGAEFLIAEARELSLFDAEKTVKTSVGDFRCLGVLLATGAQPKMAGFRGEEEFRGCGVSYCATCDGMLYRGRAVAVWGLSPEAPQEANFLHGIGCSVTYIAGRRPDTLEAGVAFRAGRVEAVEGGAAVEAVRVGGAALPVQGVFILRAATPPDALVPGLALENGFVKTDAAMRTNIPGLFAAGDMTGKPLQVANAVGDGLVAALAAVDYLDGVSPMTD